MDTEEYESILLVKSEVFVYKIGARTTNRGYRAADWNLGAPDWTGRMRLVTRGQECIMKLEDKITGQVFAKCPVDKYPGLAIQAVNDSSRYFVVKVIDDSGRSAFIGLGFGDRSDSFDLNVALQDHFKYLKNESEAHNVAPAAALDLGFKEGQTIKINMKIAKRDGNDGNGSKPKAKFEGGGLLPPPPGGAKLLPPPSSFQPVAAPDAVPAVPSSGDLWGDFVASPDTAKNEESEKAPTGPGWVTF